MIEWGGVFGGGFCLCGLGESIDVFVVFFVYDLGECFIY